MKLFSIKDQSGIAHLGLVLAAVVVLGGIGGAGYFVMNKNKDKDAKQSSSNQAASVPCDIDDKDICKFYSSWEEQKYYKIEATTTAEGKTSTFTIEAEGKDKSHMKMDAEGGYETISIGDTTYTKDPADGKWWKQTFKPGEEGQGENINEKFDFDAPSKEEQNKTQYKKEGKEACGDLTCFKYQVIDPEAKDQTDYIWFDDKDYQLRRATSEGPDGKTEMTFSYSKVEIKAPTDVKEGSPFGAGSGSAPSEAEIQQMIEAQQSAQ